MLLHKNKFLTTALLTLFVLLGIAAIQAPQTPYKNLKILPRDIPAQKLDSIMQSYNVALGVNCKFCHVPLKNIPDSLDYASDAEPMKEEARKMLQMTIYINKTHFYFDKQERPEYLKVVSCNTCHRGEAFPEQ